MRAVGTGIPAAQHKNKRKHTMLTNLEIEDLLAGIPDSDKVCGNCAHWGWGTLKGVERPEWAKGYRMAYPCMREDLSQIEPDVGASFVLMLSEYCTCMRHGAAFEPSEDYIAERSEVVAEQRDKYKSNGVHPSDFM
jgi:hypothetical protein